MSNFEFIEIFIQQLFNNSGLRSIFVFTLAIFGIQIIYRIVAGFFVRR